MYLHEQKENFKDLIEQVSATTGRTGRVVEKDYYVTLILRLLSQQLNNCVFKGGTSLSKGFGVIDRFSEDIDIAFSQHISDSQRKHLKNTVLKNISLELKMPITNWQDIRSRRDYNAYHFAYNSIFDTHDDQLLDFVKLETTLGSYSFPTQKVEINNYIGSYLLEREKETVAKDYGLDAFSMNLQTLERTFIDKVFAICDYYLQNKSERYSRHLYDIHKLYPVITFNEAFVSLIQEVRKNRAVSSVRCPSAQDGINIPDILCEFCQNDFYKNDYSIITEYFTADNVKYEDAVQTIISLAHSGLFAEKSTPRNADFVKEQQENSPSIRLQDVT